MFEAIVLICLTTGAQPCREVLLPGYEGETRAACEAALDADPPQGNPVCKPALAPLPVTEIAPGVFVHTGQIADADRQNLGDVANLGFVIGVRSVAVIDSGAARWIAEALWRAIRARTDKPVSHVILTHMHPDHVFGASLFEEVGAEVVAHAALPRALADRQENYLESLSRLIGPLALIGTTAPRVSTALTQETRIDLGERELSLTPWPVAHSPSDLTVYDATTGTLFAGDLLFHDQTPALDGSLLGWQAVMAQLEDMPLARVVPGHGPASLPWPEGAADQDRYLARLLVDTRAAIKAGTRLGEAVESIAEEEAPHWQLFKDYNPRNATVAFTELEWE